MSKITTFDLVQPFDGLSDFEQVWNWLSNHFETPWPDTSLEQSKACGFQPFEGDSVEGARAAAIVAQPFVPFMFVTVCKNVPDSLIDEEFERNMAETGGSGTPEESDAIRRAIHIRLLELALPETTRVDCAVNIATNRVYILSGSNATVSDFEVVWNMHAKDTMGTIYQRDFDRVLNCTLTEDNLRWFKAVDAAFYGPDATLEGFSAGDDDEDPQDPYKYDCGQDFLLYLTMRTEKDTESDAVANFEKHQVEFMRGKIASYANRGKGRCTVRHADDFLTSESETAMSLGKKPDWLSFVVMVPYVQAEIKLDKTLSIKGFKLIQDKEHPDVFDYASEALAKQLEQFESVRGRIEKVFCEFVDAWIEETPQEAIRTWLDAV